MQTLGALLEQAARQYGARPALLYRPRYRTEVWSYTRLWEQSGQVAANLREHGIEQGDRIVIWAPNSPCWGAASFGCLRLGAILVPLDVRSSREYMQRVVQQTEPKLAFLSRLTAPTWDSPIPVWLLEDLEKLPEAPATLVSPSVTP